MTPSEQYTAIFTASEPNNYTQIPNIVDELTYDEIDEKTGVSVVKRLSVYAIQLYRILRKVAGDTGACWKNAVDLGVMANMSEGQVSKCKKELQNKFHQLDGNPLISITQREKTSYKDRQKTNGTTYHVITINNIWGYNGGYFFKKKIEAQNRASSPNDPAGPASSPGDPAPQRASSLSDPNKNNVNKNPLFKEQQPAASSKTMSNVCSLNKEVNTVPPAPDKESYQRVDAFNALMRFGFDATAAAYLSEKHDPKDLLDTYKYYQIQKEKKRLKGETFPNPQGYFRSVLVNRYWEK